MSTNRILGFTVTDLLGGDVLRLITADEPDRRWDKAVRWLRHRLTAALVAAVGVIQGDEVNEAAAGHDHHSSVAGHGQYTEWTPSDGH